MKRIYLGIGSLTLAVLLGINMLGYGVDAQDTATPAAADTESRESARETYLAALAANLGVTPEELQAAMNAADSELGGAGGFPGGKGDGPRRSMGGPGGGGPGGGSLRGVDATDAAAFIGVTEAELETDLDERSFLEVSEAHGKTIEEVRAFLIQQATEQIDKRLQAESAASAGAETSPAEESSDISDATVVPTAPALTPAETATA